jgi:hypothetical protein
MIMTPGAETANATAGKEHQSRERVERLFMENNLLRAMGFERGPATNRRCCGGLGGYCMTKIIAQFLCVASLTAWTLNII